MIVTPPNGPGRSEVNFKASFQDNFAKLRVSLSHPQYTLRSSYFPLTQYISIEESAPGTGLVSQWDAGRGYAIGPVIASRGVADVYGIIQTNQRIASGNLNSGTFIFEASLPAFRKIIYRAGLFTNISPQGAVPDTRPYRHRYGFWFESRAGPVPFNLPEACAVRVNENIPTAYICVYQRQVDPAFLNETPVGVAYVPRTCWNIDPLDGTGESTKLVDFTQSQNLVIDFSLSSQGIVRFGVLITGVIYFCHFVTLSGNAQLEEQPVNFFIPNLPLRYEFENSEVLNDFDAVGPETAMNAKFNCSYFIENGVSNFTSTVVERGFGGELNGVTAEAVLLAVRLKIGNSYTTDRRDAITKLFSLSIQCTNNQTYSWSIYLNPDIAGVLNFTDIDGSTLQQCNTSTAANTISDLPIVNPDELISKTKQVYSGFSSGTVNISLCELAKNICYIGAPINAALISPIVPADVYGDVLVVSVSSAAAANFVGSMTLREVF